jgi:non-specific serine/threonine protein kinase
MAETLGAGTRLGHYRILGKLGAGGMGQVYRAEDLKLERQVAIKTLAGWAAADRNAADRFLREAKLASSLSHPGIVTVHAIEEADGTPFLVMELVEGETLRDRVGRGPLDIHDLISVGAQVADALDAAHRVGLIHRDVKSTNILLTPDGRAKVADFGLAKRLPGTDTDPNATAAMSLTATGAVVGTAAYMSPEQSRGEGLDARTDLFSLGVVLYEAATGRLPFEGPTVLTMLHEIALVEPPAPSRVRSGLPRALDHVVLRAMAKSRDRRFATAGELANALRAVLETRAGEARDAETPDRVPSRIPNNLPSPLTSFVGRRDEMEEVARLLGQGRLVTLAGAGGCGKSRLSVQIARNLLESFPDGAWIAELASLDDPGLVAGRVATAVGVREEPGRPIAETLAASLEKRSMLLLLDNCEHVLDASARLARSLLMACPGVRILVTSREPLGIAGEVVWRVPPLPVPEISAGGRVSRRAAGRSESVRLFAERAAASLPSFTITDENAATVAMICARLDGIPLAIELAAVRVKVLPLAQILSRLEHRFRLLTAGSPGSLPHQQTLRATVDWSYELLGEDERTLFDRLSVFAGGAGLEAVEAVCSGEGIDDAAVLDLLSHLVDKSLILPEEGARGTARYRLLETLREYGRERLGAPGAEHYGERHARHYLDLAERVEPELTGPDQGSWFLRLEEEHDNLRRAGDWALGHDANASLRLGGALWRFWWVRGHFTEGRRRLDAALRTKTDADSRRARARALRAAAILARGQSDHARARSLLGESLELEEAESNLEGIAACHHQLGNVADVEGGHDEARRHYEAGLAIRRELGDKTGTAALLHNLGVVAQAQQDFERARSLYSESLAINRELGNESNEASALNALGSAALDQGDTGAARSHHEESLVIHRRLRDKWGIAFTLHELGRISALTGALDSAEKELWEALQLFEEMGDRVGSVETLEHFALLAAKREQDEEAVALAGAAAASRDALGAPATDSDREVLESGLGRARGRLGEDRARAAEARGRALRLGEAIRLVENTHRIGSGSG